MSVYEAKLIKPFLFVSMMLFATAAATCASISGSGVTLQIVGEIQPGDDQRVKEHLERTREPHVFAFVTSNGGGTFVPQCKSGDFCVSTRRK